MDLAIPVLVVLIVAVLAVIARQRLRIDRDEGLSGRGSLPGKGQHQMHSDYSSGLGGNSISWTIPRDPQDYAKRFIPKDKSQ